MPLKSLNIFFEEVQGDIDSQDGFLDKSFYIAKWDGGSTHDTKGDVANRAH